MLVNSQRWLLVSVYTEFVAPVLCETGACNQMLSQIYKKNIKIYQKLTYINHKRDARIRPPLLEVSRRFRQEASLCA